MGDNNLFCVIFQKEGDGLNPIYYGQISGEGASRVIDRSGSGDSSGASDSSGAGGDVVTPNGFQKMLSNKDTKDFLDHYFIKSADELNQFKASMGSGEFKITDEMAKDIQKDSGLVMDMLLKESSNDEISDGTIESITLLGEQYANKYSDDGTRKGLQIAHTAASFPGAESVVGMVSNLAVKQNKPVINKFRNEIVNSQEFERLPQEAKTKILRKFDYAEKNADKIAKQSFATFKKNPKEKKRMFDEKRKNVSADADPKAENKKDEEKVEEKPEEKVEEKVEETVDHTAADSKNKNAETNVEEENKVNEDEVGKGKKTNEEVNETQVPGEAPGETPETQTPVTDPLKGAGRRTKRKSKHHRRRKNKSKNKKR